MRSQISPRVLCLLTALLLCISPACHSMKVYEAKTESIDYKQVKAANSNSYYFSIPVLEQKKNAVKVMPNLPDLAAETNTPIVSKNIPNEVLSMNNGLKISSKSVATNENITSGNIASLKFFKTGMFYGFTIMVILLNLVCFFLFEEKIFLFYAFAITGVVSTFIASDALFPILGISGIENIPAMESTLLLIATAFGALFASNYLSLEEFYPKLKWVTTTLLGFAFMMIFSGWISETIFFTSVANSLLFGVLGLYFTAGILLFSKKNYAKFYAIAFSIPLLFTLDFFVFKKLGVDFLSTESFHLKAAFLVQMLLITYAIMYRMRAIKEEHLLRQTEMRIFLKRQEVMNRTNTEKLMQDMYLENLIMQYDLDGFEIKLLQYISEGKDNVKIARKLKTTELEIEAHTKELYNKLDIGEQIQEDFRMVENQPDYIYN